MINYPGRVRISKTWLINIFGSLSLTQLLTPANCCWLSNSNHVNKMPHPCCFAPPTHSVYIDVDSPLLYPCCCLWMRNNFNPRHTSVTSTQYLRAVTGWHRTACLKGDVVSFICVCSLYWLKRLLEVSAEVFEWSWVVKWGDFSAVVGGGGVGGCRGLKKSGGV